MHAQAHTSYSYDKVAGPLTMNYGPFMKHHIICIPSSSSIALRGTPQVPTPALSVQAFQQLTSVHFGKAAGLHHRPIQWYPACGIAHTVNMDQTGMAVCRTCYSSPS